jgi:hypothetical protein
MTRRRWLPFSGPDPSPVPKGSGAGPQSGAAALMVAASILDHANRKRPFETAADRHGAVQEAAEADARRARV